MNEKSEKKTKPGNVRFYEGYGDQPFEAPNVKDIVIPNPATLRRIEKSMGPKEVAATLRQCHEETVSWMNNEFKRYRAAWLLDYAQRQAKKDPTITAIDVAKQLDVSIGRLHAWLAELQPTVEGGMQVKRGPASRDKDGNRVFKTVKARTKDVEAIPNRKSTKRT